MNLAALQHRKTLAHHGHAAFVEVAKWAGRGFADDTAANELRCVAPLLHRHLRNTWQRLAILIEGCRIADHKDLGMSGPSQHFLNPDPAAPVCPRLHPLPTPP